MSGVDVIGALLRRNVELAAVVSVDSIKAGMLPDGVELPALLVRMVSGTDYQTLIRGQTVHVTERISVTVRAESYRDQRAVIRLVRAACAGFVGDIANVERVSVLTAGMSPDVIGPANSFEQSADFRVSFDTSA